MTGFIYRYRVLIVGISVMFSLAGLLLIPSAKTDPDIRNYIPQTLVSRINTDSIELQFGVQDIIMLLFHDGSVIDSSTLNRISLVTDGLSEIRGISDVMSLTNAVRIGGDDGFMVVGPAVPFFVYTEAEIESLKSSLANNPLVMGSVVSDDFSSAAVIAYLDRNINEEDILASVDSLLALHPGKAEILGGGLPYIRRAIMSDVKRDGIILVPMALAVMLLLLWISFREWRGVVIPFTVVLLSLGVAMGLAPLLGWKLSIVSLLVPVMMIAIANNYGIHLIARYQEFDHSADQLTVKQIITKLIISLRKPVVFTGLTTIAGILGLLTHSIIPARQVGVLTALGVGYALLLSLFFIPAWLTWLPRPEKKRTKINGAAPDGSAGYLARTGRMVSGNPRTILIISIIVTIGLGSGIIFLKVDSNQENFFPSGHPVKRASTLINKNFGGSQTISVMVECDMLNPSNMKAVDEWCNMIEMEPGTGNVMSIASVVREMSKALFDSTEAYYDAIPDTREALAQMVEIYNMSGDPGDFEQLVDLNYTKAHIIVRFSNPSPYNVRNIATKADLLGDGIDGRVITGGYAYIMEEFSGRIVRGQISSILFALTIIFLLLILIFRSFKRGVIAVIPLIASIIILLGIMGWTGIALDPATALLSSVMIGIGVDYTIHFMWRHQGELMRGLSPADAAARAIATTGRGIVFNALSVMTGFSVLLFSGFTSIRFFGFLVIVSIGVCLVAALMMVPAMMIINPEKSGSR
ncbi:MAG: MMPL family transporter [Bacteroidales bacterium]|nr:MMPL family transporter [Bacteroidales bacterium]